MQHKQARSGSAINPETDANIHNTNLYFRFTPSLSYFRLRRYGLLNLHQLFFKHIIGINVKQVLSLEYQLQFINISGESFSKSKLSKKDYESLRYY